jgi:hypothetical protein
LVEPLFLDTSVLLPALVALGPEDSPAMRHFVSLLRFGVRVLTAAELLEQLP